VPQQFQPPLPSSPASALLYFRSNYFLFLIISVPTYQFQQPPYDRIDFP